MARIRARALLAGGAAAIALAGLISPSVSAAEEISAAHVSDRRSQAIDNIGASGAWWVNDLGNFSPRARAEVARLLFGSDGLDLSAYRYNIGGGGTGVTTPERAPQDFLEDDGSYDWSKDPGGRAFLKYAARYGVEDLIAFVNSAPAEWKTNGKSCGGHLDAVHEKDFARYIADVTDHFARRGARFDYISPFNEPTNSFDGCGQEGMLVDVGQRDDIVRTLGAELDARGRRTGIIADESSSTDGFNSEVPQWLSQPGTSRYVDKLAHHTYNNPSDASRTQVAETARSFGKESWSTEICCFGGGGTGWKQEYDPTIDNALLMSRIMHKDFTVAHDSAFHWWVALSNMMGVDPETGASAKNDQGWNDGLIYYDPTYAANGNQKLYLTKRYYALGQYSRFVRPGAVLHEVTGAPSGVEVSAFKRKGRWTLVVNNHNATASELTLTLPGSGLAAKKAVRTSATENWAAAGLPSVDGNRVTASLPARSITTYVIG
ncbi:glycoside hydrolase family 30 protein [Streptomyces sp. KR80]|uniref:glycoside hydrolase family 30 protein n=1 Tax=Streptomyces sp. KR80 TaxID=3457426 RepID=UPI003FD6638C